MSNKVIVQEWPQPVKRKCFELYLQRYSAPEIQRRTTVPANTVYRWVVHENWGQHRAETVLDLSAIARDLVTDTIKTLNTAVRVASKVLSRIEAQLDEPTPPSGCKCPSDRFVQSKLNAGTEQQSNLATELPSNLATEPQSNQAPKSLAPKDLAVLATALKDSSEVLLRVFDK